MKKVYYWLLEIKRPNKIPLFFAHFHNGFALTADPVKACCFVNPKHAKSYLDDLKKKHPEFLNYEKVEILEHGFETNPMAGL